MAKVKVVSVNYGLLGHPNNRKIQSTINKWMKKGYILQSQTENPFGCFLFAYAGKTRLTFIKNN